MKIDSVQVSNVAYQCDNSKGLLQELGFSEILSQIVTIDSKNTDETADISIELPKVLDEEPDVETVNPLPMFMVIPLYERGDPNLFILNENDLTKNVELIDEGIISTDNKVYQLDTSTSRINYPVNVAVNAMDTPSIDVSFIVDDSIVVGKGMLVDNSIVTDNSMVVDNSIVTDNSMVVDNNMAIPKEVFAPILDDPPSNIKVKDYNLNREEISAPEKVTIKQNKNEFISEKELRAMEIIDVKPELIEVKKEEIIITKNKNPDLKDNAWINANAKEFGINNFNTKINTQEPELFKENIQAVNDSIIKLVETTTVGDSSIMKVKLYPKELGDVNITLKFEEGKLVAKILVDSDYVKQLFTGKINELSESLARQNIFIEKIDIDFNTSLDHNLNSNSNSGKHFNQNAKKNYSNNQRTSFTEKPINEIKISKVGARLGEVSILA